MRIIAYLSNVLEIFKSSYLARKSKMLACVCISSLSPFLSLSLILFSWLIERGMQQQRWVTNSRNGIIERLLNLRSPIDIDRFEDMLWTQLERIKTTTFWLMAFKFTAKQSYRFRCKHEKNYRKHSITSFLALAYFTTLFVLVLFVAVVAVVCMHLVYHFCCDMLIGQKT